MFKLSNDTKDEAITEERKPSQAVAQRRRGRRAGFAVAAVVAAAALAPVASGAQGWNGLSVSTLPSEWNNGINPSWALAVTEDLGGPGVDIWNNNHGALSEALVDLGTPNADIVTAREYGSPLDSFPDSHGLAFSDIDGDGDEDLLEVNGRNHPSRLFRNDNGQMTIVDPGLLADELGRGRQGLFFDYDNDGDMDVIISNLDLLADVIPQNERQLRPTQIYLNIRGDGTEWRQVTDPAEIIDDGNIPLLSFTSTGPGTDNILVTHNVFNLGLNSIAVGVGRLQEAPIPAVRRSNTALPIREVLVGDFDNDLHPEFIAFSADAEPTNGTRPIFAHEVTEAGNARTVTLPTGPDVDNCRSGAAADFDNDGDLDILAGCAQSEEGQVRNVLLINDGRGNFSDSGGGTLTDAATGQSAQFPATAGAIVAADIDGNGWMDAVIASGFDFDRHPDQLVLNQGCLLYTSPTPRDRG